MSARSDSSVDMTGLQAWLRGQLARECGVDVAEVDVAAPFARLGLGSLAALRIVAALAERVGRALPATLLWEHPSVAALVQHLSSGTAAAAEPEAEAAAVDEPIAIVGMACRLPGAGDVEALWGLLRGGVDAVSVVPAARGWDAVLAGVSADERDRVRRGAFLARVDEFDPLFFGISPREAAAMDPQQRLMLELCWEALEDAGIRPGALAGAPAGVFAGAIWSEYDALLYQRGPAGLGPYTVTGGHRSILANRVSYVFGLRGPSMTIDSACSSGLVVAHLACDSLRRGECRVALAGAVNLNLLPDSALAIARFGALSATGRCHTFDARADGYVRGEGGGVVVLKKLSQAIADGDPVRAVIVGSAVNNDGASNGLTAPSRAAQEELLAAAYRRAGVARELVQYVEAHGTGTPLGDPIEARALSTALAAGRPADAPLLVGSIKTNIGHLEGAAGIAGLIKTALAIERRMVPPSLHFTRPSPHAPLAELGLAVPTTTRAWPAADRRLTAGVSSFGLGGTNSHVVLQEWPGPARAQVDEQRADAVRADAGVVFVCPGQGAQWPEMARTLMHDEPVIRATLAACDRHIVALTGWSLLAELAAPAGASRLDRIEVSLPAIIALDVAVAAWWQERGLVPAAVVGHSTGEIAAAYIAGALDLADTMRVICAYGRLVGRFAGRGGMAYVGLPWNTVTEALVGFEGRVFRAIQDSAEGSVVAGEPAALRELQAALQARGVFCRPVNMNVGPHSPLVDAVREELRAALQDIRPRATRVPLISEVTGTEVAGTSLDAAHWVRNFGDPAVFSAAIDELIRRGHRVFLDVGPHPITRHAIETNLRRAGARGSVLASLRRGEDGRAVLREAAAALRAAGRTLRDEPADEGPWLLPVSARSPGGLRARAAGLAGRLADEEVSVRDVVYTASVRREGLAHRAAVVGGTREALTRGLLAVARGEPGSVKVREAPRAAFVFSGQGSQWAGMGRGLLAEPGFMGHLEECDELLRGHVGWSLLDELAAPAERSRLDATEVAQPAIFAVQVGIAAVLRGWGFAPDAVIGHSVGELAAAHVAGALSLAEALRVVAWRGRILQRATGLGQMAWVALPREAAARAIAGREATLAIAAVNDPGSVVLSGETTALAEVLAELAARGVEHRRLRVNYAFHSPQMDGLAAALVDALGRVDARPAKIPLYSTVTGARLIGTELDAGYWARNVRQPVELVAAVRGAVADGGRLFVEVGPHPVLAANLRACLAGREAAGEVVVTLRRDADERAALRTTLGAAWALGREVEFAALQPGGGKVVTLPNYPWQRQAYWVEGAAVRAGSAGPAVRRAAGLADGDGRAACTFAGATGLAEGTCSEGQDDLSEETSVEAGGSDDGVYEVAWRARPLAAGSAGEGPAGAWLVLGDAGGVAGSLVRALRARGAECAAFATIEALTRGLDAGCRGVIHCGGLDAAAWADTSPATLAADVRRGALAAILLAQAIVRRGLRDPPRLVVVTRGAMAVATEPVSPAQAPVWGLARALVLEHPELECTRIDLPATPAADEVERLVGELLAGDGEEQVALRPDGRFVARLVRGRLPAETAAIAGEGSYLITGGLGGLGLALAGWLVARGARALALVGRRAPSEAARAAIAGLEAAGARVAVLQGDVADAADVARLLAEVDAQVPGLRGVVHAAGVLADRTVAQLDEASLWPALLPKMFGAWSLHAATSERRLDFFVMFSSVAALLGSPGQAAYAAGNAFMDALARARVDGGRPAISVQWGPFSGVGMAAMADADGQRMAARGLESFTTAEGLALLGRALAGSRPEVGLVRLSLRRWLESTPQASGMRYLAELQDSAEAGAEAGALRAGLLGRPAIERAGALAEHVTGLLAQVLQLAPGLIDRRAPFASLGLDSLTGLEARNRLERDLGLRLSPTLFFMYPHVEALAGFLLGQLAASDEPAADERGDEVAQVGDDDLLAAFDASLRDLGEEELL